MRPDYLKITTALFIEIVIIYTTFSSWYVPFGVSVMLVPLLFLLDESQKWKYGFWKFSALSIFTLCAWATVSTFWIATAFWEALIYTNIVYLYFLPVLCFSFCFSNKSSRYSILVVGWLLVEYYHLHGTLGCAYTPIGNTLGKTPFLIQWYEYTGVLGGSYWLLLINIFIYQLLRNHKSIQSYIYLLIIILIPVLISFYLWNNYTTKQSNKTINVATIELGYAIDSNNSLELLKKLKDSTKVIIEHQPDVILWPESGEFLWGKLDELQQSPLTDSIQHLLKNTFSELLLFAVGVDNPQVGSTFNEVAFGETKLNVFSLVIGMNKDSLHYFRTKQKYVPAEEYLPNTYFYRILKNIIPQQGSYYSSSLPNETVKLSYVKNNHVYIAPLICYELLYGDFTSKFVKQGADLIVSLQNEAWVEGIHQENQMLYYSALRAIENRKEIIKVSNLGLNAHINSRGEVLSMTKRAKIFTAHLNHTTTTFYTKHGDIIILSILISITLAICFSSIFKQ